MLSPIKIKPFFGILFIILAFNLPAHAKNLGGAYISSYPNGASIQLDDEDKGTTPALLNELTPGDHVLKLTMPGYLLVLTQIEIKANELGDFKYTLEPRYGSISVLTTPSGADIFLDGKFVGRSPKRINDVLIVDHWVKVNQPGYEQWENKINMKEEKLHEIHVELKEIHKPKEHSGNKSDCRTECHDVNQSGAKLQLSSKPSDATVYINGEAKGQTPITLNLSAGSYKLRIEKSDYIPQEKELTLDFKQELNLEFSLEYNQNWKDMIFVPAGEFTMGYANSKNSDEQPVHRVYLDAYYIDKYEVTNGQYRQFVKATGYRQPSYEFDRQWGEDNQPVIGISWEDATAYTKWAGKRLPTEAEWEKAAKGLIQQRYTWSNQWQLWSANTLEDGKKTTVKVGSYPQGISPFGVYDMLGNVWEWCSDWYAANYYQSSPEKNPQGPSQGKTKVIRGGGWNDKGEDIGITTRNYLPLQVRLTTVGFRCVKDTPH